MEESRQEEDNKPFEFTSRIDLGQLNLNWEG